MLPAGELRAPDGKQQQQPDDDVFKDIRAVVKACKKHNVLCKCILETCLLTDDEKQRACQAAVKAKADFVKTSTGFSTGGATVEDVALMSAAVAEAGLAVCVAGTTERAARLADAAQPRPDGQF